MTALPPIESRRVLGVDASQYIANKRCAHPDCGEPVPDRGHHIFPRSAITNGKYFVQAWDENGKEIFPHPIPHVTGLCRQHHDAVEQHDAWIKLENDGFVWYDRAENLDTGETFWIHVGPLDPQPGGREKANKPKRKRLEGDARARRKKVSIHLPEGVDGGYWDTLLDEAEQVEQAQPDTQYEQWRGGVATGKLIVTILERFTGRAG